MTGRGRRTRRAGDRRATGRVIGAAPRAQGDAAEGRLVVPAAVLAGFGVVAMYSATAHLAPDSWLPPHFVRHVLGLVVAVGLAFVASRVPLATWRRFALPLWIVALLLLAATLGFEPVKGARRWLHLPGGLRFQPVDLVKLTTLLALAALLSHPAIARSHSWRSWWPAGLLVLAPAAILMLQPDMGNAVILALTSGLVAFVAGAPLRIFVVPATTAVVGVTGYVAVRPYALERIRAFLDPWGTDQGAGFQLVQSFVAFGRGGLFGVGVGDGRQKLAYLPEAHTDFILSVVAEELGMLGVLVVLGAFAALLIAGTQVALRARDLFVRFAAFGMTALLAVPALVNTAVVTGMLPPKGLSLPFLSYGRSSLLVSFVALGLLLRLCRCEGAPPTRTVGAAHRTARVRA